MKPILFSLICFFFGSVLYAQFGPEQIITTELDGPDNITIGDIDGDSFPDLLIGSRFDNKLTWSKNMDGLGTFGPLKLIASAETRNLSLADLDGDNDLDIIAPYVFLDKIVWFENLDGAGNYGSQRIIDNDANAAYKGVAADIDGDGDMDIVAAIDLQQSAVWYENLDGLGNFGPRKYISFYLLSCRSVFVADIDNDGDLDVVANSADSVTISWFENLDGQGNFGPQNIVAGEALYVADVFCADIDGDGDLDIMGTTNAENRIAWHENLDGLGTFGPQRVVTNEALHCTTIFCADLDNDGDQDVVFGSTDSPIEETSEVAWCENIDGGGNFGPKQVLGNTLRLTRAVYAADIDGDTDMDVFATSQNNDKVVWYENQTVLGVEENSKKNFRVYPNPGNDKIFIDSKNEIIDKIAVYDILGKQLFTKQINVKEFDVSNLQNGLYFLRITTDHGAFVQKFIKE